MKMIEIVALGELLIDFTQVEIAADGQRIFKQNPGGAPANVLCAASKLGAKTAFIGKVGDDLHGRYLKNVLRECNVDADQVILDPMTYTTLAFVQLNEAGDRRFSFARKPGADMRLRKEEIDEQIFDDTCILHVGSLSLTDNPAKSATIYAIQEAKKRNCIISYDPNYRAGLWSDEETAIKEMRSIIKYADVMKLAEEEMILLTSEYVPEAAATYLFEKGVKIVVITLGASGAYVYTKNEGSYVPGYQSLVVNTTGAGDAFWGGFLYQLINKGKMPEDIILSEAIEMAYFANAVASLCVEKDGAIYAMPNLDEVNKRMKIGESQQIRKSRIL